MPDLVEGKLQLIFFTPLEISSTCTNAAIMPVLFRLAKKMAINSLTTIISENDRWGFYDKTINVLV